MQIKIGDVVYDSENEPIMATLTSDEKRLIAEMSTQNHICSYPTGYTIKEIEKFMGIKRENKPNVTFDFRVINGKVQVKINDELLHLVNCSYIYATSTDRTGGLSVAYVVGYFNGSTTVMMFELNFTTGFATKLA